MKFRTDVLFPHEHLALIEALRRDLKIQQEFAGKPGPWLNWHEHNVRMIKRLLDAINPKSTRVPQESAP